MEEGGWTGQNTPKGAQSDHLWDRARQLVITIDSSPKRVNAPIVSGIGPNNLSSPIDSPDAFPFHRERSGSRTDRPLRVCCTSYTPLKTKPAERMANKSSGNAAQTNSVQRFKTILRYQTITGRPSSPARGGGRCV